MFSKWVDKLRRIVMDDNLIDQNPNYVEQDGYHNQPQNKSRSYLPNEVEGRVHNIYPKPGAYRFPIELDPKPIPNKNKQKQHMNMKQTSLKERNHEENQRTETKKESIYFQGTLKTSTVTPSPVYGFKKDPSLSSKPEEAADIAIDELAVSYDLDAPGTMDAFVDVDTPPEMDAPIEIDLSTKIDELVKVETPAKRPVESQRQAERFESQRQAQVFESQQQLERFEYQYPQMTALLQASQDVNDEDDMWIDQQAEKLMETFHHFNLRADLIGVTQGPTVTRFEIQPAPGIKISKFTNLQDDLKLSLAAKEIRIEAPIPGKHAIGIEVPNSKSKPVHLGDILLSDEFQNSESPLSICLGADLSGDPVITDIQKMPHGLIAGSTGSGKSVCINSLLVSLLYKASPEQLRLLLIDPKVVELTPYQSIPHLVTPVVTDPKRATATLKWAVDEMERRYLLFAEEGVRDLKRYNTVMEEKTGEKYTLPYIVIIIDELADLMMVSPQDVEDAICRITQKARACGIHLIVATQRPSVDVITGLIKANIPTRLAFSVSSQIDSRTILDMSGAERLLGRGDMLFLQNGASKPIRVQGNFVSDEEIERIIKQVSSSDTQRFLFVQEELLSSMQESEMEDELIEEATFLVMEQGVASASSLQRKFRIGYNRAARLIDWMEEKGIISESLGSKPRQVLWSQEQYLDWLDRHQEGI